MKVPRPETWEYRAESSPDVGQLNELGAAGWELAGIQERVFYLKRPKLTFRDRVTLDQKRNYYDQWIGRESGATT